MSKNPLDHAHSASQGLPQPYGAAFNKKSSLDDGARNEPRGGAEVGRKLPKQAQLSSSSLSNHVSDAKPLRESSKGSPYKLQIKKEAVEQVKIKRKIQNQPSAEAEQLAPTPEMKAQFKQLGGGAKESSGQSQTNLASSSTANIHSSHILHATKKRTLEQKKNSMALNLSSKPGEQLHIKLKGPGPHNMIPKPPSIDPLIKSTGQLPATQTPESTSLVAGELEDMENLKMPNFQGSNMNKTQQFMNSKYKLKQLQLKTKVKQQKKNNNSMVVEEENKRPEDELFMNQTQTIPLKRLQHELKEARGSTTLTGTAAKTLHEILQQQNQRQAAALEETERAGHLDEKYASNTKETPQS